MKNICNIVSGPVAIITSLAVLTLTVLELKDKIQKSRMKKAHVAQNEQQQQV